MKTKFNVGDEVVVCPTANDTFTEEFAGEIIGSKLDTDGSEYFTVEDQDGDCFDVNSEQLTLVIL